MQSISITDLYPTPVSSLLTVLQGGWLLTKGHIVLVSFEFYNKNLFCSKNDDFQTYLHSVGCAALRCIHQTP